MGVAAGMVLGRLATIVDRRSRGAVLAIGVLLSSAAIVAPATPVVATGDLSVLIQSEAGRSVETESGEFSFLRLSNQGGAIVPNVTVRIDLPDVVEVDGWDPEDGCSLAGETVVCPLGDIPGYGIRTVGVGFYVPSDAPEGDYAVLWSVTTGSVPDPSVYADEFTIVGGTPPPPPVPDVSVHQTLSHPSMTVGAEEYFLLELYNDGDVTVPGLEMFTGVPNDFELVGVSDPSCTISGRIVKCIYWSLDPGDSRTVQIDVIPQDGAVGELITSTVYLGPVGASSSGVFWDIDESFVSVYPAEVNDANGDGVDDSIQHGVIGGFDDGTTNGVLQDPDPNDAPVEGVFIEDIDPGGVRVTTDSSTTAVIHACGGFTLTVGPGSVAEFSCGSITVVVPQGTASVSFGGATGDLYTVTVEDGEVHISDAPYAISGVSGQVSLTDASGVTTPVAEGQVVNTTPVVVDLSAPIDPVRVGTPVSVAVAVDDPDAGDTVTCDVDWADGATPSSGESCSFVHTYTEPGVYEISATAGDGRSDATPVTAMIVVYDPTAGFVAGGGWIDSPEGAYTADPTAAGKATFGFVSKYKKGAQVPSGNTQFQFQTAGLTFHSSTYQWLVVTGGDTARFKGTGTIDGTGEYRFMIWASDDDPDTFRISITDLDGSNVYDNGTSQRLGGGNITVHS